MSILANASIVAILVIVVSVSFLLWRRLFRRVRCSDLPGGSPGITAGEQRLLLFVSSVISPELKRARQEIVFTIGQAPFLAPWAFEYTSASSESVDETCLRKVREADFVIWLAGDETTEPVCNEIREALTSNRRLLVFKLPMERPGDATEALVREVGGRAKWVDVAQAGSLRRALELTLADEIIRALRGRPELGRIARLEELGRTSRARCMARWQAAGVLRAEASAMADDPSIGAPGPSLQPRYGQSILLLLGEIGAGKSLIAERFLQGKIIEARESIDAPVPVYLEAQSAVGQLQAAVEVAARGLGNPRMQGAFIIIDGADEAGNAAAAALLAEARVLADSWLGTMTVITSRPIPALAEAEEAVRVPQLAEAEIFSLIGRVAGRPIMVGNSSGWPRSVQDAVRRPLFAVLLGAYLREQDMRSPRSIGELLYSLVERSLSGIAASTNAAHLLQRLAFLSTDRGGGPVPSAEVASPAEVQPLLSSGLVVESTRALAFPLPILTQWFAAQSLAAGLLEPDDLVSDPQRLEHWRYPLIIFASSFSNNQVSRLLMPLAEHHPALASEIVNEGLARWGLAEDVPPPPPRDCGRQIRAAMQAWTRGLGPLAFRIAPVRENGTVMPIAVRTEEAWLTTAWYFGGDEVAEVHELPSSKGPLNSWPRLRIARPGRVSAWPWRWALDELVAELSRLLQDRALPAKAGPIAREAAWEAALTVTGRGSLDPGPLPLAEIEDMLSRFPEDADFVRVGSETCNLAQLRLQASSLRSLGEREFGGLWPGPDQELRGGPIWNPYSNEGILARARAVYAGALDGYQQLVADWLPKLSPRLQTAVTLPALLVGVISPPVPDKGLRGAPIITWYLEALPHGSENEVVVHLSESPDPSLDRLRVWNMCEHQFTILRSLRPEAAGWISFSFHHEVLDVFRATPATEIAYDWLWDDLKRVSWVTGLLGNRS